MPGRAQHDLIKALMEQNPHGKIPLERPKTRWVDLIKKHVQSLDRGTN